jgi:tetratricopeptide (TPR) repeat protein
MLIKIALLIILLFVIAYILYELKALLKKPQYEIDYNIGIEFYNQKQYKEAEDAFERSLMQKEDHYQSHYNMGLTCLF